MAMERNGARGSKGDAASPLYGRRLLLEVLAWLEPFKDLLRLHAVSRAWREAALAFEQRQLRRVGRPDGIGPALGPRLTCATSGLPACFERWRAGLEELYLNLLAASGSGPDSAQVVCALLGRRVWTRLHTVDLYVSFWRVGRDPGAVLRGAWQWAPALQRLRVATCHGPGELLFIDRTRATLVVRATSPTSTFASAWPDWEWSGGAEMIVGSLMDRQLLPMPRVSGFLRLATHGMTSLLMLARSSRLDSLDTLELGALPDSLAHLDLFRELEYPVKGERFFAMLLGLESQWPLARALATGRPRPLQIHLRDVGPPLAEGLLVAEGAALAQWSVALDVGCPQHTDDFALWFARFPHLVLLGALRGLRCCPRPLVLVRDGPAIRLLPGFPPSFCSASLPTTLAC